MRFSKHRRARIILAIQQSFTFELSRIMVGVGTVLLFLLFTRSGVPFEIGFAVTAVGCVFVGIVAIIVWGIRDAKKIEMAKVKDPLEVTPDDPDQPRSGGGETPG